MVPTLPIYSSKTKLRSQFRNQKGMFYFLILILVLSCFPQIFFTQIDKYFIPFLKHRSRRALHGGSLGDESTEYGI